MIENLISFSIATIFLALAPGPDNIYVIAQSLANGIKSGIATTIGLVTGCIVHTTFLAFGLSAILMTSPLAFYGIKVIGALYLLYLAYKTWKSDSEISITEKAPRKSNIQLFKQGVFMNIVNPKVMIFFLAFFPGFLWNETEGTVLQFYILGGVFMLISFFVFSSLSILAGYFSSLLNEFKIVSILLKWLQIIVFIGISVFILIP